ncbi:MAG: DsbA family protein [Thermoflexales bacterium]
MSKRKELEARRREQQRKQTIQVVVIIAAIAVIVIGGAIVLSALSGQQQQASALPPVKAASKATPANAEPNGRAWGPADAPIKVEEYLDYQCPACGQYGRNFEPAVIEAFAKTGKVRYEVNFLPFLEDRVGGRESRDAVQAALCAADQDKFWQMHATLFVNQLITGQENVGNYSKPRLKEMAATIEGMDTAAFNACLDSNKHEGAVLQIRRDAEARGVQQTPTFFVNGQPFPGVRSVQDFRQIFAQVAPNVKLDE